MASAPSPQGVSLAALLQSNQTPSATGAAQLAQQNQQFAQILQEMAQPKQNQSAASTGVNLLAEGLARYGQRQAQTKMATAQQGIAKQLFPSDPRMQLAYLLNPGSVTDNIAKSAAPLDVRAGNTILNAPPAVAGQNGSAPGTFTAPILRDDGGQMGTQGVAGYASTGVRAPNYGEQTAQATQQQTTSNNAVQNALRQQEIANNLKLGLQSNAIAGQNANINQQNANTTSRNQPIPPSAGAGGPQPAVIPLGPGGLPPGWGLQ